MEAVYCDKCGKIVKKDNSKQIVITGLYACDDLEFDFCKDCSDNFEAYLYTEKYIDFTEEKDGNTKN